MKRNDSRPVWTVAILLLLSTSLAALGGLTKAELQEKSAELFAEKNFAALETLIQAQRERPEPLHAGQTFLDAVYAGTILRNFENQEDVDAYFQTIAQWLEQVPDSQAAFAVLAMMLARNDPDLPDALETLLTRSHPGMGFYPVLESLDRGVLSRRISED